MGFRIMHKFPLFLLMDGNGEKSDVEPLATRVILYPHTANRFVVRWESQLVKLESGCFCVTDMGGW